MVTNNIERFSRSARRVLMLAQDSARSQKYQEVQITHLLWGLVYLEFSTAALILSTFGADRRSTCFALNVLSESQKQDAYSKDICLSFECRKAIESAIQEAKEMKDRYIGTHHLLMGILVEPKGVVAEVLERFNINLTQARIEASRLLN